MAKEVNLEALGKFAEGANTGNFDLFKDVVSPENLDHDPAVGQVAGPEGYRLFFLACARRSPISMRPLKP